MKLLKIFTISFFASVFFLFSLMGYFIGKYFDEKIKLGRKNEKY